MSHDRIFGLNVDHKVSAKNPNEVQINCPFCTQHGKDPDTKYHLNLNVAKRAFTCFRCGESGGARKLRDFFDIEPTVELRNFSTLRAKLLELFKPRSLIEHDLDLVSMPLTGHGTPIAWRYMTKIRRFSEEELRRYGVRVGRRFIDPKTKKLVMKWSGRIIFPHVDEAGKVKYLVGRSYDGKEPKYLNSYGDKTLILYGLDRVKGEAIVCEGLISAFAAERATGVPAVCLLGKTPSEFQINKLKSRARKVWVCLDGTSDITDRLRSRVNRAFIKAGFEVWEIKLPLGSDPDDARDEFKKFFEQARRVKLF